MIEAQKQRRPQADDAFEPYFLPSRGARTVAGESASFPAGPTFPIGPRVLCLFVWIHLLLVESWRRMSGIVILEVCAPMAQSWFSRPNGAYSPSMSTGSKGILILSCHHVKRKLLLICFWSLYLLCLYLLTDWKTKTRKTKNSSEIELVRKAVSIWMRLIALWDRKRRQMRLRQPRVTRIDRVNAQSKVKQKCERGHPRDRP